MAMLDTVSNQNPSLTVHSFAVNDRSDGTVRFFQDNQIMDYMEIACGLDAVDSNEVLQQAVEYTYFKLLMHQQATGKEHFLGTVDYLICTPRGSYHMNVYFDPEKAEEARDIAEKNRRLMIWDSAAMAAPYPDDVDD